MEMVQLNYGDVPHVLKVFAKYVLDFSIELRLLVNGTWQSCNAKTVIWETVIKSLQGRHTSTGGQLRFLGAKLSMDIFYKTKKSAMNVAKAVNLFCEENAVASSLFNAEVRRVAQWKIEHPLEVIPDTDELFSNIPKDSTKGFDVMREKLLEFWNIFNNRKSGLSANDEKCSPVLE